MWLQDLSSQRACVGLQLRNMDLLYRGAVEQKRQLAVQVRAAPRPGRAEDTWCGPGEGPSSGSGRPLGFIPLEPSTNSLHRAAALRSPPSNQNQGRSNPLACSASDGGAGGRGRGRVKPPVSHPSASGLVEVLAHLADLAAGVQDALAGEWGLAGKHLGAREARDRSNPSALRPEAPPPSRGTTNPRAHTSRSLSSPA
jgi:hypothetical protein